MLWRFGLPNVPALFFMYVIEFSDRLIIEYYHGLEVSGLYSAGYKMGMFMALITNAFRFAWQPFFLAEAKNEGAQKTFARIFTYFYAISGFLFMIFVMFAADFVMLKLPFLNDSILDKTYWAGMMVFPVICLAHLFDGLYANFTVGIYIKKKTHMVPFINGAGAIFNLVANLLVIPKYGMMGAAVTTLGSFIIMAVFLYLYINRHYPIQYEWERVVKFTLVFGSLSVLYFLYPGGIWWRIILLLLLPVLLVIFKFFKKEEIGRVRHMLGLIK
jgi:O-antigen/teichoic acid export membrane protein